MYVSIVTDLVKLSYAKSTTHDHVNQPTVQTNLLSVQTNSGMPEEVSSAKAPITATARITRATFMMSEYLQKVNKSFIMFLLRYC